MSTTSLDRRRFLQIGTLGVGVGLARPTPTLGQKAASSGHAPAGRVRMVGDGLGLTPAESAELWTELAESDAIEPDAYSIGGTVGELEAHFAAVLGKERAVFMPTGTLANHLAVRALAGGTGRAIVQAESHLFNDSGDCVQTLSGITLMPIAPGRATFTLDDVRDVVGRTAGGRVARPVSVISLETPVRRRFGETFDEAEMDRVTSFAAREGIRLHLDGARLFLQSAYTGRAVADYARAFDTVYVSLYKYFNAASGAILAGPRALLDDLYHTRRMFGAGLPGAWPFASIARHYAPGFVDRFRQAVAVSEAWIARVARHDAFTIERIPGGTNIFRLRVSHADPAGFRARLASRGVDLGAPSRNGVPRRDGAVFLLTVNETWNRTTPDALADAFVGALRA